MSLLVSLLYQVSLDFSQASIYVPMEKLAELKPEKTDRLKAIARGQFHYGRGILWASQSRGLERLLAQSSFALCTPTGSGKTLVANLAIVKELLLGEDEKFAPLALYIVPSRALAGEVEAKLSREMKNDLVVTGLYGGTDWGITDAWLTADSPTVLIATVEKADALIRYLGPFIIPRLKLLIVDEAHQVVPGDIDYTTASFAKHSERSIRLESFVSRLLTQTPNIARIALTAVAGGAAGPVARWIEGRDDAEPVGLNYRSTRQLIGILETNPTHTAKIQLDLMNGKPLSVRRRRDPIYINLRTPAMPQLPAGMRNSLNRFNQLDVLWTSLQMKSDNRRILISIAQLPERTMGWFKEALELDAWTEARQFETPEDPSDLTLFEDTISACIDYCGEDAHETALLRYGIASSHGQIPQRLRRLMTALIERGICPITVTTATLTEGVNLPFDLIFVPQLKRSSYDPNTEERKVIPISASEFNNLSGRAGRPGAAKGMEGITLVAIPSRPSTTATGMKPTQRGQITDLVKDYKKLRRSLHIDMGDDSEVESPIALLITALAQQARKVLGLNADDFLIWLETISPPDITEDAGQAVQSDEAKIADTLDELDSILLSAIEEIDLLGKEELEPAKAEEFLANLWHRTFSQYAAVQEEWLEVAFVRRGMAIVGNVYPDSDERRKLYHYGFPPHLGRRFEKVVAPIKEIFESALDYGVWEESQKIEIFKSLGTLMTFDQGYGFQIRATATDLALLENWEGILEWWLNIPEAFGPEPKNLRSWQRFVTDNLEFRLGVAIGAVVASVWSEGVEDPLTAPSLEEWRQTTGLPWLGFWARELLRWGTLDPFVAFMLAQGLAKTRETAANRRYEFDAWLVEKVMLPESDDYIDPQHFLAWQKSHPKPEIKKDKSNEYVAEITNTTGNKGRYIVIPLIKDEKILWIDPAGFELAQSDIPEEGTMGLSQHSDYELITDIKTSCVKRQFDGRR